MVDDVRVRATGRGVELPQAPGEASEPGTGKHRETNGWGAWALRKTRAGMKAATGTGKDEQTRPAD